MAQIINTNLMSLNAQRNLSTTQNTLSNAIQRLSTGLRVNSAKDDAAGLAIAERMNAQVRGMNVAIRNSNDGISLAQTAEGSLGKVGDMLQRMRELAVQSANATNSTSDQTSLNEEFSQLQQEIGRTIDATKFNGASVLKSTAGLEFQVGAGVSTEDKISVTGVDLSASSSEVFKSFTTSGSSALRINDAATSGATATQGASNARAAITQIDSALSEINSKRAQFGAVQNRFESVISNLQVAVENQSAARSRIMDADFASETAALTRSQVLQQAGTAMLSQANSIPNNVLALLR